MASLTNPQVALLAAAKSSDSMGTSTADSKIVARAARFLTWLRDNDREVHPS